MSNTVTVKNVQQHLGNALEEVGFVRIRRQKFGELWGLPDAAVFPFYYPILFRKHGGVELSGLIGVHVDPFESFWLEELKKFYPGRRQNNYLFARYMTNFREFIAPPVIQSLQDEDISIIQMWASKVFGFLQIFPKSPEELVSQLEDGVLGTYPVSRFLGPQGKVKTFVYWARNEGWPISEQVFQFDRVNVDDPHYYEGPSILGQTVLLRRMNFDDPYSEIVKDLKC